MNDCIKVKIAELKEKIEELKEWFAEHGLLVLQYVVYGLVAIASLLLIVLLVQHLINRSDLECKQIDIQMNSGTVIRQTFCFSKETSEFVEIKNE